MDVLNGVASLVDQSLVKRLDEHTGEQRFALLEIIREYALERAVASGCEPTARERHAAYFLGLAEAANRELHGGGQLAWLRRLEREHDNLRAALNWTVARGATEMGLRFVASLAAFWIRNGHLHEGLRAANQLLSQSDGAAATLRASALAAAGQLCAQSGDYETARLRIGASLALYRELRDPKGIARALQSLGYAIYILGDRTQGQALCEESVAVYRAIDDRLGLANALRRLGWLAGDRGELDLAERYAGESLALIRAAGDPEQFAYALRNLYNVAWRRGDFERATKLCSERLALHSASGNRPGEATAVHDLAIIIRDRGDYARARELFADALVMHKESGYKHFMAQALQGLAEVAAAEGLPERAARLFGAADAIWDSIGVSTTPPTDFAAYQRGVHAARAQLGDGRFDVELAAGRAMPMADALEFALQITPG